jgi:hypothetical protein
MLKESLPAFLGQHVTVTSSRALRRCGNVWGFVGRNPGGWELSRVVRKPKPAVLFYIDR